MVSERGAADRVSEVASEAKDLQSYWRKRDEHMAQVRLMLTGHYMPQKVDGMTWFFTNEAKTLMDLAVSTIAGKPPIWRMPVGVKDRAERRKSSKGERFIEGMYREVTRGHRLRLHGDWLSELTWYILTGGYAVFPHIDKDEDERTSIRWDLWDPIQVYPLVGQDGIEKLYRVYYLERETAILMAQKNGWRGEGIAALERGKGTGKGRYQEAGIRTDPVQLTNCWYVEGTSVANVVVIDGVLMQEDDDQDGLYGRIPIKAGPGNGVPFRDFDTDVRRFPTMPDWREIGWEAVIDTNANLYVQLDRLLTYELRMAEKLALGTLVDTNDQGTLTVDPNKDLGRLKVIARKPGEKLEWLPVPDAPREREALLQYLVGAIQRGGMSHTAYGVLGVDVSGVTLQQLLTSTRSRLLPYVMTLEDVLAELAMETMGQARRMNEPFELAVMERGEGPEMAFRMESFDPATDLPEAPYVEVEAPLSLPDDTMERIQIARQARPDGNLLDWTTVADKILKVQDPEAVMDRMHEDDFAAHPVVQGFEMVLYFTNKAKELRATGQSQAGDIAEQVAVQMMQQLAAQAMGGDGQGGGPNAQGSPRTQAEPNPSVQPAEAGPMNPDRMRQVFKKEQTPSRPPTTQDRLRNMGLVAPGGK